MGNWKRQQAAKRLQSVLKVQPRKRRQTAETKLVDITVQGEDPKQAVREVNAVAAAYVQHNLDKRLEASRKATSGYGRKQTASAMKSPKGNAGSRP